MNAHPAPSARPTKSRSANASLALGMASAGAAGGLVAWSNDAGLPSAANLAVGVAALAAALTGFKFCVDWWRTADEAVREAHKFAWYWGGSLGMGVGGGAALVLSKAPPGSLDLIAVLPGDGGLFATGALACIVCQLIGYGVAWAGWWLVRR